ncbi:LamG-like jellyroll fold domain-containing protein [Blastopirellula marina]|uniref:LamG-like jellyroll fold domain-containing protein n=1 Tax=Blastopirellula marina TaxID=124 RepID=A0A2S8GCZ5_9BACT|nr:LamG-like jellyroll fold domain-containing protein [Blastopirellula marina]PQO41944.1 hypothetical protein C5Y98_02605 [Blastopirellula marina]PTL46319.1 PEP-CTERM sorting domain-containing protein [Blastopirellula marina]
MLGRFGKKQFICMALLGGLLGVAPGLETPAQADLLLLFEFDDPSNIRQDTSGNDQFSEYYNVQGSHYSDADVNAYSSEGFEDGAVALNYFNGSQLSFIAPTLTVSPWVLPQMTWGAWVKPADNEIDGGILDSNSPTYNDPGNNRSIRLQAGANGAPSTWVADMGTGIFDSGVEATLDDWTFLAVSYDEAASQMTFYVNDQSFAVATNFDDSSPNGFLVGEYGEFPYPTFTGLIDNVFVYDEALDANAIAQIQNNGFGSVVAPVPEPTTAGLMLLSLLGGIPMWLRRRAAAHAA